MAAGAAGAPSWPAADLAEESGVCRVSAPGPWEAKAEGLGARTTGQPPGAPFSLPPLSGRPGCRHTHLPAGNRGPGWGCGTREVCRLPWGSPLGPRLGPAAAAETAAGTARARGEAGPAGRSEEGAGAAGRRTKPPFFPPAPAPPFLEAAPAPRLGTQGARKDHATRCLLCSGSRRRQPREQGRAK